ncbi:hypothetical protein ACNKHU_14350 [Shigella flexneri]
MKPGLVDDVVPHFILLEAAVELVKQDRPSPPSTCTRAYSGGAVMVVRCCSKIVGKKTEHKTKVTIRRQNASWRLWKPGLAQGTSSGYDAGARAFGELAMTPQSQALRIFFSPYGREERSRQ